MLFFNILTQYIYTLELHSKNITITNKKNAFIALVRKQQVKAFNIIR